MFEGRGFAFAEVQGDEPLASCPETKPSDPILLLYK